MNAIVKATDTIPTVYADTICRTRANRNYCKTRNIRLSGKPIERPPKETESNREELKAQKKQILTDERSRILVEGKFGNAKRKGTLSRVMGKLRHTAESIIHIGIIVLNIDTWLRQKRKEFLFALIEVLKRIAQWFWNHFERSQDLTRPSTQRVANVEVVAQSIRRQILHPFFLTLTFS